MILYTESQLFMGGIAYIKQSVAAAMQVTVEQIDADRRDRHIVRARQVAMYLTTRVMPYSLPRIGRAFGRDHTTVLYAREAIGEIIKRDHNLRRLVGYLEEQIKADLGAEAQLDEAVEKVLRSVTNDLRNLAAEAVRRDPIGACMAVTRALQEFTSSKKDEAA